MNFLAIFARRGESATIAFFRQKGGEKVEWDIIVL
jgi:hypothetical protein